MSVFIQTGYLPNHLLAGLGLIYFEALLIMTISMACSSALSALATGGIVFGLYGLAFIGGWIEQIGAILQNQTASQSRDHCQPDHPKRITLAQGCV